MTLHSTYSALGSENSAAVTTGRRKRIAERIEYDEPDRSNVRTLPGSTLPQATFVVGRLVGSCGHTLRWLARVPVVNGEPQPPYYLTGKLGRRMTCQHNDCKIPPKTPKDPA